MYKDQSVCDVCDVMVLCSYKLPFVIGESDMLPPKLSISFAMLVNHVHSKPSMFPFIWSFHFVMFCLFLY